MSEYHVIHLRGSQTDMGTQYGRLMAEMGPLHDLHDALTSLGHRMLRDANHRTLGGRLTDAALKGLTRLATGRLHRHRPQAYRERSMAFMEAAGMARSEATHVALMDAFQNIVGWAGRTGLGPFAKRAGRATVAACSTAMVWDDASSDGRLRHARNLDYPAIGLWDRHPTVVFCEPDDGLRYGYVSTLGVDIPGVTGFNEAGLSVAAHTRFHRDVRFNGRCIVDLCHDLVRRAETLEDAVAICREHPIASTWGLAIGSTQERRAAVIETTGNGAWVVHPKTQEHSLVCTNRNRHPDLQAGQVAPMPAWAEHADSRTQHLEQRVASAKPTGGMSAHDLMDLLGDHTDPHTGDVRAGGGIVSQACTVQSVVFSGEEQRLHLSVGKAPTGCGPYAPIEWDWSAAVGHQTQQYAPDNGHQRKQPPNAEAYSLWSQASRYDMEDHDADATLQRLEAASEAAPDESTYRFMAGILCLHQGRWSDAQRHLECAAAIPQSTFRAVQTRVWAARAADANGNTERATQWRVEALEGNAPHCRSLQALAKAEQEAPVSRRRLRGLSYNIDLVDASR